MFEFRTTVCCLLFCLSFSFLFCLNFSFLLCLSGSHGVKFQFLVVFHTIIIYILWFLVCV